MGFGFGVDFRQEGTHHFLVQLEGEQVFDVPLFVRLAPLPSLPSVSPIPTSMAPEGPIVIEKASYGSGTQTKDVTQIVRDAVGPGGLRIFVSTETLGGDPALNVVKRLVVSYRLPGSSRTEVVEAQENQELVVP
jgi:hypothetical protein